MQGVARPGGEGSVAHSLPVSPEAWALMAWHKGENLESESLPKSAGLCPRKGLTLPRLKSSVWRENCHARFRTQPPTQGESLQLSTLAAFEGLQYSEPSAVQPVHRKSQTRSLEFYAGDLELPA